MGTVWRDDELLTVRGRYGGRRGRAPNCLLKALSRALWIFSSCLSCFFSSSTWIIGIANTIINIWKDNFQAIEDMTTSMEKEKHNFFLSILKHNKKIWSYIFLQCYSPLSAWDLSIFGWFFGNIWFAPLHSNLLLQENRFK